MSCNSLVLGEVAEVYCGSKTWSITSDELDVVSSDLPAASFLSLKTALTLQKEDASVPDPLLIIIQLASAGNALIGLKLLSNARFLEVYLLPSQLKLDGSEDPLQSGKYLITSRGTASTSETMPTTANYSHDIDLSPGGSAGPVAVCLKVLSMKQPIDSPLGASGMCCAFHNFSFAFKKNLLPVAATTSHTPVPAVPSPPQPPLGGMRQEVQDMREKMRNLLVSPPQAQPFGPPPSLPGNSAAMLSTAIGQQLQAALQQMQANLTRDLSQAIDAKIAPIMLRLDRLEQKIDGLKQLTENSSPDNNNAESIQQGKEE